MKTSRYHGLAMRAFVFFAAFFLVATAVAADTVILRDGSSYSGQFTAPSGNVITFTDGQGVQYRFPPRDVLSLVFTSSTDVVTLRSGKVYSGQYTGADSIAFTDDQGIQYQFPLKDVASLTLAQSQALALSSGVAKVIPVGTEISIRAGEAIDSDTSTPGQLYSATVSAPVQSSTEAVAIPAGAPAQLVVRKSASGGVMHGPQLVLDLYSVTVSGKEYRVVSSSVDENNRKGVGANRRTAEFIGGGTGIGALMGAVFGGGRGAGIGAASGAAGGLVTQIFTRGKQVKVPAETLLTFQLYRTLVLRPKT